MMPEQNRSNGPHHHGFPYREVIILVLCVSVDAYSWVNVFPYVGVMVMQLMGLKSINEAGYYAGYVASALMFGRFVSGYAFGYLSDRFGRKPILIFSLSCIIIFSLTFGVSQTFAWALSSRLLFGLTNGVIIAARASLRELCGREHVVVGMVYINGARAMALVLGTGVGGLLAMPAVHYPEVFSQTGIFARYPFLLPNLFGVLVASLALPMLIFCYPETKDYDELRAHGEFKRLANGVTNGNGTATNGGSFEGGGGEMFPFNDDIEQGETELWRRGSAMRDRIVPGLLFVGCTVQILVLGFAEAFPLWMLSTPDVGGLGWTTKQVGEVLLTTGILLGVIQCMVLPYAMKFIGILTWYRVCWVLGVVSFVLVPNAKALSWNFPSLFVVDATSCLLVNCCTAAIGIAATVASTNIVSPQHRGKLSSLYSTAENLGRLIGPAAFSMIYAMSISRHGLIVSWIDHHFVFYYSAIVLALLAVVGWRTLSSDVLDKTSAS